MSTVSTSQFASDQPPLLGYRALLQPSLPQAHRIDAQPRAGGRRIPANALQANGVLATRELVITQAEVMHLYLRRVQIDPLRNRFPVQQHAEFPVVVRVR